MGVKVKRCDTATRCSGSFNTLFLHLRKRQENCNSGFTPTVMSNVPSKQRAWIVLKADDGLKMHGKVDISWIWAKWKGSTLSGVHLRGPCMEMCTAESFVREGPNAETAWRWQVQNGTKQSHKNNDCLQSWALVCFYLLFLRSHWRSWQKNVSFSLSYLQKPCKYLYSISSSV